MIINHYKRLAKKMHKKLGPKSPGLMKCQHILAKELGFKNWGVILETDFSTLQKVIDEYKINTQAQAPDCLNEGKTQVTTELGKRARKALGEK